MATAAAVAGAVMVSGSVGHATDQFISVKTPFQLDGDAMDVDPTSDVFPDGSDPIGGLQIPQGIDDEEFEEDSDDWAKFDADGDPMEPTNALNPLIVGGDCTDDFLDALSCGHVAGAPGTVADPGGHNGNTFDTSVDGHDGGNSRAHFYARDQDRASFSPLLDNRFTRGTSLNQDICDWRVDFSSTPPKDDFANLMAAFYGMENPDPTTTDPEVIPPRFETFFYGGSSVIAPNGTAKVAYWLLLGDLELIPPLCPGKLSDAAEAAAVAADQCIAKNGGDPREPFAGRFMPTGFDPLVDADPCLGTNASGGRNELHTPGDIAFAIDFEGGGSEVKPVFFQWVRDNLALDGQLVPIFTTMSDVENNCQFVGTCSVTTTLACSQNVDCPGAEICNVTENTAVCATTNSDLDLADDFTDKNQGRVTHSPLSYEYDSNLSASQKPEEGDLAIPNGDGVDDMTDNFGLAIKSADFPGFTLFEGGFNFQAAEVPLACFNTFIPTTVASTTVTAAMKDMFAGRLPLCNADVTKDCDASFLVAAQTVRTIISGDITVGGALELEVTLDDDPDILGSFSVFRDTDGDNMAGLECSASSTLCLVDADCPGSETCVRVDVDDPSSISLVEETGKLAVAPGDLAVYVGAFQTPIANCELPVPNGLQRCTIATSGGGAGAGTVTVTSNDEITLSAFLPGEVDPVLDDRIDSATCPVNIPVNLDINKVCGEGVAVSGTTPTWPIGGRGTNEGDLPLRITSLAENILTANVSIDAGTVKICLEPILNDPATAPCTTECAGGVGGNCIANNQNDLTIPSGSFDVDPGKDYAYQFKIKATGTPPATNTEDTLTVTGNTIGKLALPTALSRTSSPNTTCELAVVPDIEVTKRCDANPASRILPDGFTFRVQVEGDGSSDTSEEKLVNVNLDDTPALDVLNASVNAASVNPNNFSLEIDDSSLGGLDEFVWDGRYDLTSLDGECNTAPLDLPLDTPGESCFTQATSGGHCSITADQACANDAGCPGGETCEFSIVTGSVHGADEMRVDGDGFISGTAVFDISDVADCSANYRAELVVNKDCDNATGGSTTIPIFGTVTAPGTNNLDISLTSVTDVPVTALTVCLADTNNNNMCDDNNDITTFPHNLNPGDSVFFSGSYNGVGGLNTDTITAAGTVALVGVSVSAADTATCRVPNVECSPGFWKGTGNRNLWNDGCDIGGMVPNMNDPSSSVPDLSLMDEYSTCDSFDGTTIIAGDTMLDPTNECGLNGIPLLEALSGRDDMDNVNKPHDRTTVNLAAGPVTDSEYDQFIFKCLAALLTADATDGGSADPAALRAGIVAACTDIDDGGGTAIFDAQFVECAALTDEIPVTNQCILP